MSEKLIRLPEVMSRTGLSRSGVYLKMSEHCFPASINLGERAVAWLESEIDEWIDNRIKARNLKL